MTKISKDQVRRNLQGRLDDLDKLFRAYQTGDELEDLGTLGEYGLSFDYVPKRTFRDQKRGYFRYQLSWGGHTDEFRFFVDEALQPVRIEYWFLDWFDGAHITLRPGSREYDLMVDIWDVFDGWGMTRAGINKALNVRLDKEVKDE